MCGLAICRGDLGQYEAEDAAAARRAIQFKGAIVRLGSPLGNGQSQAGAAHLPRTPFVDTIKSVEDLAPMFLRDTRPVIFDLNCAMLTALPEGANGNATAGI